MKRLFLPVLLVAGLHAVGQKNAKLPIDYADKYSQVITPAGLKEKLTIIASAEMEGRETASPGQKRAAAYIEGQFQKFGILPGTTGGYQMQFPVYQDSLIEASLTVNQKEYKLDESWFVNVTSAPNGTSDIKEVVFLSFGMSDQSRNDYNDLEVKGKWVLMFEGSPTNGTTAKNKGEVNAAKIKKAIEMGAKGIFIMSADFPRKRITESKGRMFLKKQPPASVPVMYVSSDLAHELVGMNPKQLLQSIKNIPTGSYISSAVFTINKRTLMLQSSNVLGILPGTDKKDEYVVISGHYDHLGKRGNDIYYGADDDGSGTTAIMQLAEAFSKARNEGRNPRRSIVFIAFSGEEKGLLGSEFYSDHPSFPLDKTTVNLNIDMVGRIDPDFKGDSLNYLYVIGDDKLSTDLTRITDSINNLYSKLQLDRKYNDLKDPNQFYYRSDHYNFAKKGVPVIFYFNGTHADYHKPTDTVDKINFDLMSKRVKLVFLTAWDMANRNNMLKRDIPLPK